MNDVCVRVGLEPKNADSRRYRPSHRVFIGPRSLRRCIEGEDDQPCTLVLPLWF